ncbi:hypothetical protein JCM6882_005476 [Rhodosporidiobolus microsporus]
MSASDHSGGRYPKRQRRGPQVEPGQGAPEAVASTASHATTASRPPPPPPPPRIEQPAAPEQDDYLQRGKIPAAEAIEVTRAVLSARVPPVRFQPAPKLRASSANSSQSGASPRSLKRDDFNYPEMWLLGGTTQLRPPDFIEGLVSKQRAFLSELASKREVLLVPPHEGYAAPHSHGQQFYRHEDKELDTLIVNSLRPSVLQCLECVSSETGERWVVSFDNEHGAGGDTCRGDVDLTKAEDRTLGTWMELKRATRAEWETVYRRFCEEVSFPVVRESPKSKKAQTEQGSKSTALFEAWDEEDEKWRPVTKIEKLLLQIHLILCTKKQRIAGPLSSRLPYLSLTLSNGEQFFTVFSYTSTTTHKSQKITLHHLASGPLFAHGGTTSFREVLFTLVLLPLPHNPLDVDLSGLSIGNSYPAHEPNLFPLGKSGGGGGPKDASGGKRRRSSEGKGKGKADGSSDGRTGGRKRAGEPGGGGEQDGQEVGDVEDCQFNFTVSVRENGFFGQGSQAEWVATNPHLTPPLPSCSTFTSLPTPPLTNTPSPFSSNLLVLTRRLAATSTVRVFADVDDSFVVKYGLPGRNDEASQEFQHELSIYPELWASGGVVDNCVVRWVGTLRSGDGFYFLVLKRCGVVETIKQLAGLEPLALVDRFHTLGYIHGDLAVRNFGVVNGQLRLFDLGRTKKATVEERETERRDFVEIPSYRLSHLLELPAVSAIALSNFSSQLTVYNVAYELFDEAASLHDALLDAALEVVEENAKAVFQTRGMREAERRMDEGTMGEWEGRAWGKLAVKLGRKE